MQRNAWFFRFFFALIACLSAIAYEISSGQEVTSMACLQGTLLGIIAFILFLGLELGLKKLTAKADQRSLSTAVVGLFVGTVLAVVVAMSVKLFLTTLQPPIEMPNSLMLFLFLGSIYTGIMLTATSAESWWVNIPFVHLAPASQQQRKEILIDYSALEDPRLIELCRSGLLDHQLVMPTFVIKEIQNTMESQDETIRIRARKCHEHLKRLESLEHLGMQVKEFHFTENEELSCQLSRAAKLLQAYILTSQEQSALRCEEEGSLVISLETIAAALKPGAQRGEILTIKIQRLGKEPKQGVGYLEDGTMVVVNGGGEFLGQNIKTQVLSQKYSSSGKIIFCNAIMQDDRSSTRAFAEGTPYTPVSAL